MTDRPEQGAAPTTIAVIGSGYMGGGIAQVFALAGNTVRIADVSAEVAQRNHERILGESRDFEADGLFPAGATDTIAQNLKPSASLEEAVEGAEFIRSEERRVGKEG